MAGLSVILRGSVDDRLNWAFNLYDLNKDGCITKEVQGHPQGQGWGAQGPSEGMHTADVSPGRAEAVLGCRPLGLQARASEEDPLFSWPNRKCLTS